MDAAFEGVKNLFSEVGFTKIEKASFLVIGIGGVGSWICESLARSGVTKITLVDLDDICISNVNRQVHALPSNVGKLKVDVMKARLESINPNIKVRWIYEFFTESTKDQILAEDYDYIFDAIDSMKSKCILIAECKNRNLPLIVAGGTGAKKDPTQIEVKDLNRTINDPLLFQVRKRLRQKFGFRKLHNHPYKIPAVFSKEDPAKFDESLLACVPEGQKISCQSGLGSASFVTASFGFAAVSYVLDQISLNQTSGHE